MTVHPSLPPYHFEFTSKEPGEVDIKISGGPKNYRGQTITAGVDHEKRLGFFECDVNFDGYGDFAVVVNRGTTGNVSYVYWNFNPKTGVFIDADNFGMITEIDEKNHVLIHRSKGGSLDRSIEYYRVRNGKPELTKSIQTTWSDKARDILPNSYPERTPVIITRIYRDGKMHRTFFSKYLD